MKDNGIDKIVEVYDRVQRRLEESPLLFGAFYCKEYFVLESPAFHVKLAREMMDNRRLAIAAPRESAKSSMASFLKTLHAVCYGHKRHIIIIQNTLSKACGSLYGVKHQLKYNESLIRDFGIEFIKDSTEECIVKYRDGKQARILCKGKDQMGSIRGERFNELRPDLVIGDDIEDDEMVRNPDRRRELEDVFNDAVEPAVDRQRGQIIIIGTVLHDDSLIAKLISKEVYKDWRKLKYQALFNGKSLWEQKWSVEALKKIEHDSPDKFAKEYQNDPVSGMNKNFKKEDFRYWTINNQQAVLYGADNSPMASYDLKDCVAAIGCDLAWEEKRINDYTAVVPALLTPSNEILLDEYFCEKGVRPTKFMELLFGMEEKYREMTGGSVYIGFEKAKLEKVMKWLAQQEMAKRDQYLIFKDVKWDADKITRIVTTLEGRYANHTIFHRRGFGEYENQLIRVPGGVHDDLCLVGETMILTDIGEKRLDDMNIGDMVLTRNGYKEVINVMYNGYKEVVNNVGLTGTPNHPIITKNGIKRLDSLHVCDMIYIWNEKRLCIEEQSITDTLIQKGDNTWCISGGMISGKAHLSHYIDRFISTILEKFQKAILSIIKMEIPSTISHQTLSVYQSQNICDYTQLSQKESKRQGNLLRKFHILQRNGIQAQRELNGIENMPLMYLKISHLLKRIVNFVTKNLKQRIILKNSAVISAKTETKREKKEKVYNLTVEDNHEYFANGILVHNCDAATAAVRLLKHPKKKKKEIEKDDHFNWLLNRHKKKVEKKPYVFGQKQNNRTFPFKTIESYR